MGKYSGSSTQKTSSISKPKKLSDIWRGIGCLMMVGIPAISIAAAHETVKIALDQKWGVIPYQLQGNPRMPEIVYKLSGLYTLLKPITKLDNFYADALVSIIYMIVISSIISVIYAVVYSMVGPSRYGPTDAPPPKIKITKKSR
jgi:hypothetical protein